MTIKPTSDAVAVTQADRDAAHRYWMDTDAHPSTGKSAQRILIHAFARHRLASTRPMTEDVAGLVEEVGRIPVRTEIVNVDTGETGAQSVVLSLDLRDRILTALSAKPEAGESEVERLREALGVASSALSNAAENGFYVGEGVFEKINAALKGSSHE
jgi:hypothetical protein